MTMNGTLLDYYIKEIDDIMNNAVDENGILRDDVMERVDSLRVAMQILSEYEG